MKIVKSRLRRGFALIAPFLFLIAAACAAPSTQIVLLPDQDGRVGAVDVSSGGETKTLDRAWQATEMTTRDKTPGEPKALEETKVRETYREALAAQPLRPVSFVIYFRSDSAALTGSSMRELPEILAAIEARHSRDIIVSGHTDAVGGGDYNRTLSLRRAKAVVETLVGRGVGRDQIEMSYHGRENPLVPAPDGRPEPRNRRVEITVR